MNSRTPRARRAGPHTHAERREPQPAGRADQHARQELRADVTRPASCSAPRTAGIRAPGSARQRVEGGLPETLGVLQQEERQHGDSTPATQVRQDPEPRPAIPAPSRRPDRRRRAATGRCAAGLRRQPQPLVRPRPAVPATCAATARSGHLRRGVAELLRHGPAAASPRPPPDPGDEQVDDADADASREARRNLWRPAAAVRRTPPAGDQVREEHRQDQHEDDALQPVEQQRADGQPKDDQDERCMVRQPRSGAYLRGLAPACSQLNRRGRRGRHTIGSLHTSGVAVRRPMGRDPGAHGPGRVPRTIASAGPASWRSSGFLPVPALLFLVALADPFRCSL